jgi:hypothetical protein
VTTNADAVSLWRDRWEADVVVVVAYRDQFRVTDDADPLGAARVRGNQQQARSTARSRGIRWRWGAGGW